MNLRKFISGNKSVSTVRKTERECKRFCQFLEDNHGETSALEDIEPHILDTYLGEWLMSLSKPDGTPYEPDTLTSFHRSVDRYLREKGYMYSLVTSKEFEMSKQVLQTKRKQLSSLGLGNKPNKSDVITSTDEDILWTSGQLGTHSPQSLFNTIWYFNTKLFGFRGAHESRQLKWGDITLHKDTEGDEYLQFRERLSKTRQGNSSIRAFAPKAYCNKEDPTRCPVECYKLYKSHRPSNYTYPESPFYVSINHSGTPSNHFNWYKNSPMGPKLLASVMKNMAQKAGINDKKLSNHSVRRTMCTTLLQEGVSPNIIAQLSGHKNVGSLQNYSIASVAQQKNMSHILQGMSEPALPSHHSKPPKHIPSATISKPPTSSQTINTIQHTPPPAPPPKPSSTPSPSPSPDGLQNLLPGSSLLHQSNFSGSTIHIHINHYSHPQE